MAVLDLLSEHFAILMIPVVSAFVGWFTNVVAIKMMFYPTHFVGIRPFLGWQGIVPANASRLATYSTRLITTRLVSLPELFESFTGEKFGKELDQVVEDVTAQVIDELRSRVPALWDNAGEFMQEQVRQQLREEVRGVSVQIADDLGKNITDILDLEAVVVDAVVADRALMSQLFLEIGAAEFKFIARSGIWFGALFGLVQMAIWIAYAEWWILPLCGFLVGYATNWIALKLVFEPKNPTAIGPLVVQGLFHKRQREVAASFAALTAERIFNADNMVATITSGPTVARLNELAVGRVGELIDRYEAHPMAAMVLPEAERGEVRGQVLARITEDLPKPGGLLHTFVDRAVDIRESLESRMRKLDSEAFEGVLRPAFQQDEWKLIVAGAVLGCVAGLVQLVYAFAEQVPW